MICQYAFSPRALTKLPAQFGVTPKTAPAPTMNSSSTTFRESIDGQARAQVLAFVPTSEAGAARREVKHYVEAS
jgi:hypothetical protein